MNAVTVRFFWKEYRQLRFFGFALLAITFFWQVVALYIAKQSITVLTLYVIGGVFAGLYALACGATLYATEHEEKTYLRLQFLPVTAIRVLTGKLLFAVISCLIFGLVATLSAWALSGFQAPPIGLSGLNHPKMILMISGLPMVELFAWGLFFSLVTKRPLTAAILGAAVATLTIHLILSLQTSNQYPIVKYQPNAYLQGELPRCVLAVLVLIVYAILALDWLNPRSTSVVKLSGASGKVSELKAANRLDRAQLSETKIAFGRLVWQSYKQSRKAMVAFFTLLGLGFIIVIGEPDILSVPDFAALGVMVGIAATIWSSSTVFLNDQRRQQFRFFAQYAERPRLLWLARHIVWLPLLTFWAVVVAALPLSIVVFGGFTVPRNGYGPSVIDIASRLAWFFVIATVVIYCAGQFCSMFFRSGLIAGVATVILSAVLVGWCALMILGQVGWWSTLPIPIALMLATWLRAPGWIAEKESWRDLRLPWAAVVIPAILSMVAVPFYRAYEIPLTDTYRGAAFRMSQRTETTHLTFALHEQALHQFQVGDYSAAITTLHQAAEHGIDEVPFPIDYPHTVDLVYLLIQEGRSRCSELQLDLAFDSYCDALRILRQIEHGLGARESLMFAIAEVRLLEELRRWSVHECQTSDSLSVATKTLTPLLKTQRKLQQAVRTDHTQLYQALAGNTQIAKKLNIDAEYYHYLRLMPWERTRALRLVGHLSNREYNMARSVEKALSDGKPLLPWNENSWSAGGSFRRWRQSTPFAANGFDGTFASKVAHRADIEVIRDLTLVCIAMSAWHNEFGEYPERLHELALYLDVVPNDPYTGLAYEYHPEGLRDRVREMRTLDSIIPAKTPIVRSSARYGLELRRDLFSSSDQVYEFAWRDIRLPESTFWDANKLFLLTGPIDRLEDSDTNEVETHRGTIFPTDAATTENQNENNGNWQE